MEMYWCTIWSISSANFSSSDFNHVWNSVRMTLENNRKDGWQISLVSNHRTQQLFHLCSEILRIFLPCISYLNPLQFLNFLRHTGRVCLHQQHHIFWFLLNSCMQMLLTFLQSLPSSGIPSILFTSQGSEEKEYEAIPRYGGSTDVTWETFIVHILSGFSLFGHKRPSGYIHITYTYLFFKLTSGRASSIFY